MANPPSTSGEWRRALIVGGALALSGVTGYLAYRQFVRRTNKGRSGGTALEEAERKKADGIEAFRAKKYEDALRLFSESIERIGGADAEGADQAKKRELLSSCENNIAACYDVLGETLRCLEHCNLAITIKPDYAKALARRAKCRVKLDQKEQAIDDYFDLINMENLDPSQLSTYQNELDKVADALIVPELVDIAQKRLNVPLKISQIIVSAWLHSTVTNDPLLARMAKLDPHNDTYEGLDKALAALKHNQYDEIAALTFPIIDDESLDPLERAEAVLLTARFVYYQGLKEQAREAAQKFGFFWDKLDEAQKLSHKDLHVSHITLQITLTEFVESATNNGFVIDEPNKQKCYQLVDEGLRINPKNVDPLITFGVRLMDAEQHEDALNTFQRAKKLDQKHPYLRFYEIYTCFSIGLRQQSVGTIHNQIMFMEQALNEAEKPPVFALIMLSKLAMVLQNNQLALEAVKKALAQMPNFAYAVYFYGLLEQGPDSQPARDKFPNYVQKIERAMLKVIETDANYWEPYRMLGKIHVDRGDFEAAKKFYEQALELVRTRDELMVLLKERLMVKVIAERKKKGKLPPMAAAIPPT